MSNGDNQSGFPFKKVLNLIQILAGAALALFLIKFLSNTVAGKAFVPFFALFPLVLLIVLNLISSRINFPAVIKSLGFCLIILDLVVFIIKPWKYYYLGIRTLPRVLGIVGLLLTFFICFIILLKDFSTSIKASLVVAFLLGFFLPSLFWNINTLYDGSKATEYTAEVKKVVSDYGVLGGKVEIQKPPVDGMDKTIRIRKQVTDYVKGDEIRIIEHSGAFGIGWCEIE